MGLFNFLRGENRKSVINKEIYIFEAHEYDKVLAASLSGMFPSDEKERHVFLRKKACNSFNLFDTDSVEYVNKPDWNAPEVKFNGAAPVADTVSVHVGILSYFNKIKLKVQDINKLQSAVMGTNVSGMPNAGIMWFCVKLINN